MWALYCQAQEVSFGISSSQGPDYFLQEAAQTGAGDHLIIYWTLGSQGKHPYQRFQGKANIVLGLKFPAYEGDLLAAIAQGKFDSQLHDFAQLIKQDGRKITVRPLYEGNGSWYHWQAFHKNNKPENFIPAFQHLVTLLRNETNGLVRIDLNYSRRSANGKVDNFAQIFPGDDYVDQLTISSYNRCGTSKDHTQLKSFAEEFRPAYQELTRLSQRPVGVAEVGTTDACGNDRIAWYADMLTAIRNEFTRVEHVTFFFEVVPVGLASNDKEIRWRLYDREKLPFRTLLEQFRSGGKIDAAIAKGQASTKEIKTEDKNKEKKTEDKKLNEGAKGKNEDLFAMPASYAKQPPITLANCLVQAPLVKAKPKPKVVQLGKKVKKLKLATKDDKKPIVENNVNKNSKAMQSTKLAVDINDKDKPIDDNPKPLSSYNSDPPTPETLASASTVNASKATLGTAMLKETVSPAADVSATSMLGHSRPVSFGMSTSEGPEKFLQEAIQTGANDHLIVYWTLGSKGEHPYQRYQGKTNIVLGLKFPSYTGDLLAAIERGDFDAQLHELGRLIKQDGRLITVRPLYEGNGNWYHWQAFYKTNSPEHFIPAFRRIVDVLRSEARELVRFDLNYNRRSANGKIDNFVEIFPGDDYVDQLTISSYNRCGTSKTHTQLKSFAEEFRPAYQELARLSKRPVGVAEVGTTEACGNDRVAWYADMLTSIRKEFTRVEHVTFFFEVIPAGLASNDKEIHWRLYDREKPAFRALLEQFRRGEPIDVALAKKAAPLANLASKDLNLNPKSRLNILLPKSAKSAGYTNLTTTALAQCPSRIYKAPRKSKAVIDACSQPALPWSFYMRAEHFMTETNNTAINAITGEQFGGINTRVRAQYNQGVVWELGDGKSFGPQFSVGGVASANKNQWWNNQLFLRTDLLYCDETTTEWGKNCVFGGVGRVEYLSRVPDRYDKNTLIGRGAENQVYIGVESSFGGNWRNTTKQN